MDGERLRRLWRLVTERADDRGFRGWVGVTCAVVVEEVAVDGAAISARSPGRGQELVAASDDLAQLIEELQYTLGEGPGVSAFAVGGPVLVADLSAASSRWPGFVDSALAAGVGAVFAFPLQSGAIRLGTLVLHRRRPGELSGAALGDAAVLADLATAAMLTDVAPTGTAGWAQTDVPGHYNDVHIATGMLAAQLRITVDDALLRLRAHAFTTGRTLLDIAGAVQARQLGPDVFRD